jgi:hypothetical protein
MPCSDPSRRRAYALQEVEVLLVNAKADLRELDRRLISLAPGLAVAVAADILILQSGLDAAICEVAEARAA